MKLVGVQVKGNDSLSTMGVPGINTWEILHDTKLEEHQRSISQYEFQLGSPRFPTEQPNNLNIPKRALSPETMVHLDPEKQN